MEKQFKKKYLDAIENKKFETKVNHTTTDKRDAEIKNENNIIFEEVPTQISENYMKSNLSQYISEELTTPLNVISLFQDENEDPDVRQLSILGEIN